MTNYEHRPYDRRFDSDPFEIWSEDTGPTRTANLLERKFYLGKDRLVGGLELHQLSHGQEFTRVRSDTLARERFKCTHMMMEDSAGQVYVLAVKV